MAGKDSQDKAPKKPKEPTDPFDDPVAYFSGPPPEVTDLNDLPLCELIGGPLDGTTYRIPDWRFTLRFEQPETGRVTIYERDDYTTHFVYKGIFGPGNPESGEPEPR